MLIQMFTELIMTIAKGIINLLDVLINGISTEKNQKYNAKFLSSSKTHKMLNRRHKGIRFGTKRISVEQSLEHVLVSGASGSSKTTSVVIPTVLDGNHNMVITDVDGKIFELTSGFLKEKKDYQIMVINLQDLTKSEFFNYYELCYKDDSKLKGLAMVIVSFAYPNPNSDNKYWSYGAVLAIYIGLRLLKNQSIEYRNFTNLRYILQQFHNIEDWIRANSSDEIWSDYVGFSSGDEKTIAGHLSTALLALDALSDVGISHLMSKNTIDFNMFSKDSDKKVALYLIVPEIKLEFYSFFLSLFYDALFNHVQSHKPANPLFVILDEFSNMNKINSFPVLCTTLRRYNTSLTLITQTTEQIISKYGVHQAATIINGSCRTKLFFPGMSTRQAEELSRSYGRTSIKIKGNDQPVDRELITVDELIQLEDSKVLFQYKNKAPLILKDVLKPYFKQYSLLRKTKLPPVKLRTNPIKKVPLISFKPNSYEERQPTE